MADPLWIVALKLLAVALLVLLNAFFVAAEFAIVKVRTTQLAPAARKGEAQARLAQHITSHLDAYLSACQLGITLASLGLGWIGEPAVATLLEPAFIAAGIADPVILHSVSFVVAFGFITFLHIVFGELAPKSIAIRHPEKATLSLGRPLHIFYRLFRPAIAVLNGFSNLMLRGAGFPPATSTESAHSEAELREILAGTAAGRAPTSGQRARRLLGLLDLGGIKGGDIMTPISRVVFLDARRPLDENIRIADDSGFSRFPLIDGNPDQVLGMVHYRDVFSRVLRKDRPEQTLGDIRRDVLIVPESAAAETVLSDMLARGRQMAVVVDEHGRTAGILTMEDIFEEVFGSIRDEFDEPEQPYKQLAEGVYLVDGTTNVRDLEPILGPAARRPGVTTASGFVIEQLGRIPLAGEGFTVDGIEVKVREVGRRRVKSIEVRRAPPSGEAPPQGDPARSL